MSIKIENFFLIELWEDSWIMPLKSLNQYQDIYSIHVRGTDGAGQDLDFGGPSIPDIVSQTANNVIAFSSAGKTLK